MIARRAIAVKNLVKRYGRRLALNGFTLEIPRGAVLGLVGPNGAGKTTWMMCVAGLVRPDSGVIDLFDTGSSFDAARHSGRLALLPQDSELPLEATPQGFLYGLARLQGLSVKVAESEVERCLRAFNIADRARASIRSLSHGMRKRLMAAQCFLGKPELILLDEPMNGLDPEECARFRRLIAEREEGCTIVISSHNLGDLERYCTHVAFVDSGRVRRMVSLAELADAGMTLEAVYLAGDWRQS